MTFFFSCFLFRCETTCLHSYTLLQTSNYFVIDLLSLFFYSTNLGVQSCNIWTFTVGNSIIGIILFILYLYKLWYQILRGICINKNIFIENSDMIGGKMNSRIELWKYVHQYLFKNNQIDQNEFFHSDKFRVWMENLLTLSLSKCSSSNECIRTIVKIYILTAMLPYFGRTKSGYWFVYMKKSVNCAAVEIFYNFRYILQIYRFVRKINTSI